MKERMNRWTKIIMKGRIWNLTGVVVLLAIAMSMASCHKKLGPTVIQVEDSIRHYPSVILGDELDIVYAVRNVGKEMLVITDIQPACPAIESSPANVTTVPPGEEVLLKFTFHSDKNIGLARHCIRLFGNIAPKGVAELIFDTHVVRPSTDLSDYEEYYHDKMENSDEHILDGRKSEKGYSSEE